MWRDTSRYNIQIDDFFWKDLGYIHGIQIFFLHAKKYTILLNRLMTTIMESHPLVVRGKPNTKSMLMSSQIESSIGSGMYNSMFCLTPLNHWQMTHLSTNRHTSHWNLGQENLDCISCSVCLFQHVPIGYHCDFIWSIIDKEKSSLYIVDSLEQISLIECIIICWGTIDALIPWCREILIFNIHLAQCLHICDTFL